MSNNKRVERDSENEEAIGSIEFRLSAGLKPWDGDPEEYCISAEGKIKLSVGDESDPDAMATAGSLNLVVIKMPNAIDDHVNLKQVFDSYSEDLLDIYRALFDEEGNIKEELRIECVPCDIAFIESITLKPKHRSSALFLQTLETAIAAFAGQGLTVAYMRTLDFDDNEWTKCGFEVVPGTMVIFRDGAKIAPDRKAG
ncbi:MAG: hypothetical protein HYX69_14745 [Planctomycetia bacterium]|nr:hypothetical protein [Planctomycetia bacterium]